MINNYIGEKFTIHKRNNNQSLKEISSVQSLSHVWLFETHGLQYARPPCRSPWPYYLHSEILSTLCLPGITFCCFFSSLSNYFVPSVSFADSSVCLPNTAIRKDTILGLYLPLDTLFLGDPKVSTTIYMQMSLKLVNSSLSPSCFRVCVCACVRVCVCTNN